MLDLSTAKRNLNVLNFILMGVILMTYFFLIAPMGELSSSVKIPVPKEMLLNPAIKPAEMQYPSLADFMVVADKNLFHPERTIPAETKIAAEQKPEILLRGTLVTDDLQVAYIEEKRNGQTAVSVQSQPGARDKKQRAIKLGESISGYVVKRIEAESITLVKGEDELHVSIKDGKNYRRASAQESGSPQFRGPAPVNRSLPSPESRNYLSPPPRTQSASPPSEALKMELKRPVR